VSLLPLFLFRSFVLSPFLLVALAKAFPDSAEAAAATVEECRAEYHTVCHKNPKAELSTEELMASIKGRLQLMAALGRGCAALLLLSYKLYGWDKRNLTTSTGSSCG
jgi:hypothetical protein